MLTKRCSCFLQSWPINVAHPSWHILNAAKELREEWKSNTALCTVIILSHTINATHNLFIERKKNATGCQARKRHHNVQRYKCNIIQTALSESAALHSSREVNYGSFAK